MSLFAVGIGRFRFDPNGVARAPNFAHMLKVIVFILVIKKDAIFRRFARLHRHWLIEAIKRFTIGSLLTRLEWLRTEIRIGGSNLARRRHLMQH